MTARVSVEERALPGAVPAIRAAVSHFLDRRDGITVRRADLLLALTEACGNVIRHAYPDGTGDIRCEVEAHGQEIRIRVFDWGTNWDAPSPDPGMGLGMYLMDRLADDVRRSTTGEGKVVELCFRPRPGGSADSYPQGASAVAIRRT
jgi:anti-sigma regulatory factor (Ser/Thr protein kinase)